MSSREMRRVPLAEGEHRPPLLFSFAEGEETASSLLFRRRRSREKRRSLRLRRKRRYALFLVERFGASEETRRKTHDKPLESIAQAS